MLADVNRTQADAKQMLGSGPKGQTVKWPLKGLELRERLHCSNLMKLDKNRWRPQRPSQMEPRIECKWPLGAQLMEMLTLQLNIMKLVASERVARKKLSAPKELAS